jgi:hypothetical protein
MTFWDGAAIVRSKIDTNPALKSGRNFHSGHGVHTQPHDLARALVDPSWRHTRAVGFIEAGVVVVPRDEDAWVKRLVCFLREFNSQSEAVANPELGKPLDLGLRDPFALEPSDPIICWAHMIYTRSYAGPRYQLEAMLLTDLTDAEIENHLAVPPSVTAAYEHCYFDLRRHRDKPEAIRAYVDARARARCVREGDPDVMWKRAALDYGPALLTALWGTGALTAEQSRQIDKIIASQARRHALEALRILTVNAANAHEIMQEYASISRLEMERVQQDKDLGRASDPAQEIAASLFEAIQFTLAPIGRASEQAYLEVAAAVSHAPQLLERMRTTVKRGANEARDED